MAELRLNDVSSFGTANPITLTAGGTTATWTSAPPFPTIASPDFAKITVEPGTTKAEIIYVTAYTSGATTATVTRNAEATQGGQNSTAGHTSVPWTHSSTAFNFPDHRYHMVSYGVKADAKMLGGGTMASGSAVLADTTNTPFASTDVGKVVVVCNAGGNTAGQHLFTTIVGFTDSGHVTIGATCANMSGVANVAYTFGTDDTVNAQACFNAAPQGSTVVFAPTPMLTTAALVVKHSCNFVGSVTSAGWGKVRVSGYGAQNGPTEPPFLNGSVIFVAAQNVDGIDVASTIEAGYTLNPRGIGIVFAGLFTSTGHGIYASAPPSTVNKDNGLMGSYWENCQVFGHDGNHYAYNIENPLNDLMLNCLGFGGGLLQLDAHLEDSAAGSQDFGNFTTVNCYGQGIVGGTAHGFHYWDVGLCCDVRPQFYAGNVSPLVSQYSPSNFDTTGATQNTYREEGGNPLPNFHVAPDYENGVTFGMKYSTTGGIVDNTGLPAYPIQQAVGADANGVFAFNLDDGTTLGSFSSWTKAQRRSPIQAGAGAQGFAVETERPIWSDGTGTSGGDWRYADGTVSYIAGTPGGAGTAPGSVAGGPLNWWAADSLGLSDGQAVSSIASTGSGANAMAQATGGNKPIFKSGIINNKPVVRFDGSDDYMQSAFTLAQPATIFVVRRLVGYGYNAPGSGGISPGGDIFDGVTGNFRLTPFFSGTGYPAHNFIIGYNAGSDVVLNTTQAGLADLWTIDTVQLNGASSLYRQNGTQVLTGNPGSGAGGGINLGCRYGGNGGTANYFTRVDIAEVIVYNTALVSADMLSVERWLGTKYALTTA